MFNHCKNYYEICKICFIEIVFHFLIQEYAELLDEFMNAVKQNYGEKVLVQVYIIITN